MMNYERRGSTGFGAASRGANRPETTGRSLVLMRHDGDAMQSAIKVLQDTARINVLRTSDLRDGGKTTAVPQSSALFLESLGVAIVNGDPDQVGRMSIQATRNDSILAIEPERVVYMAAMPRFMGGRAAATTSGAGEAVTREYLRGYRDGIDHAAGLCFPSGAAPISAAGAARAAAFNESVTTWGLQATRVLESPWTGSGIRVAVLDTGFDSSHPDFAGRAVVEQSFVAGETTQDRQGHGTHCIGTSMGTRQPSPLPRYGVAYEAAIFVGKVLNNQGSGGDGDILAGINWAVQQKCSVVSMSLGAATFPGQKPSTVFENMARRALALGTLIVAAAGNESDRRTHPPFVAPVGHPANCPSIMAVGAVDAAFEVAFFSCAGQEPNGGQVDIAGPGMDVYSTWLMPQRYNTISGTSMATPHVAGIAALYAQANPGISAVDLWTRLVKSARNVGLSADDGGSGLVQAPVG